MVSIKSVSKVFNKNKSNEIHAINNTSLEFDDKGLVALLGQSGCGKTTLLNAVGGLDKVNKGSIFVNGEEITKGTSRKIDKIRNLNIGYIFQNYNLIEDKTVFENIAMVLHMIGIKDSKEVEEKVHYALKVVDMYRYRSRFANMLSGGERQRVAIARAIVKNPSIIIADEPTGNLDSKNTLAIMNIIKKISEEKLVILVTHERKLAQFYADRIINIKDGNILSDEKNTNTDRLDYRLENKIYLKDIEKHNEVKGEGYNFNIYQEGEDSLDVDIVLKNGNIYIQSKDKTHRVEIIEDNSSIELVDQHYSEISKEDMGDTSFDKTNLVAKGKLKNTSIFNIYTSMKNGFKTVFGYHRLKKILLLGFFVTAMLIVFSVSNIVGVTNIKDEDFVTVDKSYLTIEDKSMTFEEYENYKNNPFVEYILPGNSIASFLLVQDTYIQAVDAYVPISGSLSSVDKLKEEEIIFGKKPSNNQEVLVDKMVIDSLLEKEESTLKNSGVSSAEDMLGRKLNIPDLEEFTIVGIVDKASPCIYINENRFMDILVNGARIIKEDSDMDLDAADQEKKEAVIDFALKKDEITLKKGEWPEQNYEAIVNIAKAEEMPLGKNISYEINGEKLKVVGYYESQYNYTDILVNNETVEYDFISKQSLVSAYALDKEDAIASYEKNSIQSNDAYKRARDDYKSKMWEKMISASILAMVVLIIAVIEIFLIMRASFLSRIKEVGIYRAIGVKKFDVYKMFMGEICAITTISSMPGYLFMLYIIKELSEVSYFKEVYMFNGTVIIASLLIIYVSNILFGLLPVFNTLRKTPAEILSRKDVN